MKNETKQFLLEKGIQEKSLVMYDNALTMAEMYLGEGEHNKDELHVLAKVAERLIERKLNVRQLERLLTERHNPHFAWMFINI